MWDNWNEIRLAIRKQLNFWNVRIQAPDFQKGSRLPDLFIALSFCLLNV